MTGISLAVDARSLTADLFPDGDIRNFLGRWRLLEQQLQGRQLQAGASFTVRLDDGDIRMEVIHPLTPVLVDERTQFGIVAVRERPSVRGVYQCGTCRREGKRTYGPFICPQCPQQDRRVCDQHAAVLPGSKSLTARCPQHRPACKDCGASAVVWCPGPRCEGRVAWCARHCATHSSERATSYCRPCLAELFPPCGAAAHCDAVGSVTCDHMFPDGRPCPQRRCPRHASGWQVFGPHVEGLGRCEAHATVRGLPAEGLLYQVLGGCAVRDRRPPTVSSLRHMLMKLTERNRDANEVLRLVLAAPASMPPAARGPVSAMLDRNKSRWQREVHNAVTACEERAAQLRGWLTRNGHHQAASSVAGKHWSPPRDGKPGLLIVACDARLLNRNLRDAASAALGFDVRPETRA